MFVSRINLKTSFDTVAKITALRPALEAFIVKATTDPESVASPSHTDAELMNIVRDLSHIRASRYNIVEELWVTSNTLTVYQLPMYPKYSVSPIYRGWWGPSNGTAI